MLCFIFLFMISLLFMIKESVKYYDCGMCFFYYGYVVIIFILIKCYIICLNWDVNCFIYVKLMYKMCLIFLRLFKILMYIKISK